MDKSGAFASGVMVGRASSPPLHSRTKKRHTDPAEGLSPAQQRVAMVFGQCLGHLAAGAFLSYELYVYFVVWG
jgi:hypothetical protein